MVDQPSYNWRATEAHCRSARPPARKLPGHARGSPGTSCGKKGGQILWTSHGNIGILSFRTGDFTGKLRIYYIYIYIQYNYSGYIYIYIIIYIYIYIRIYIYIYI